MNKKKIKPHGDLSWTEKVHIPEWMRAQFKEYEGGRIPFLINAKTILLYDPKADPKDVYKSLMILAEHIKLCAGLKEGGK